MAKTLVSMPGRVGDLLWSLPAARALAESAGGPRSSGGSPVDFCFSVGPGSGQTAESHMRELLEAQAYIRRAFAWDRWETVVGSRELLMKRIQVEEKVRGWL